MEVTAKQKSFTAQIEEQIIKLRNQYVEKTREIDRHENKDYSKINIRFLEIEKELNSGIIIRLSYERSCVSAKINALLHARDLHTFIETNKNTEDDVWYINSLHATLRELA